MHQEDGTQWWTAKLVPQAAETQGRGRGRGGTIMEGQASAWHVLSADWRSVWYREVLSVAINGWSERQYRGTNHGSSWTGHEHKSNRGWGLPRHTRSQVQAVQRGLWDSPANNSSVWDIGRYSIHGRPLPSGRNSVQERMCRVWFGSPKV